MRIFSRTWILALLLAILGAALAGVGRPGAAFARAASPNQAPFVEAASAQAALAHASVVQSPVAQADPTPASIAQAASAPQYAPGLGRLPSSPFSAFEPAGSIPVGLQWSFPSQAPGFDNDVLSPYLLADSMGAIHAFNTLPYGSQRAVVYTNWTLANGWSSPVDILLSPYANQARIKGAFLDASGIVHVIFFGGDDLRAAIFYAQAPLAQAGDASAWSPVTLIGEDAVTPSEAALIGDGQGGLMVIFSGRHAGVGVYGIQSQDSGRTWSEPALVYQVADDEHWPWALYLLRDAQARVHAVWTLVNISGNGEAILYSRQEAPTGPWSDATILATRDPGDYEVDWPAMIDYHHELFLVYNDSQPATRWMRRSQDGGQTWGEPVLLFNYVGEYERPALLVDSGDNLHMLLGNRTQDAIHGMWHTVWLGDRWSELSPVISGPRITEGPLSQHFDPTAPRAVTARGNLLLVVWVTDPGAGRNGMWSAYTYLDTPELPAQPLPVLAPTPTPTVWAAPQAGFTPPPPVSISDPNVDAALPLSQNPGLALSISVIPAIALVSLVVVLFWRRFSVRPAGRRN